MLQGKVAAALQPSKFMLLTLQIICTSVITKVKNEHIYVGISSRFDTESDQYTQASSKIMFWCWLTYICLAVEFMIIFSGKTLFNDKNNLIMVGLHILGLFLTCTFLSLTSHYNYIFMLWLISSAIPLGVEI
jgi:hypothetical protein